MQQGSYFILQYFNKNGKRLLIKIYTLCKVLFYYFFFFVHNFLKLDLFSFDWAESCRKITWLHSYVKVVFFYLDSWIWLVRVCWITFTPTTSTKSKNSCLHRMSTPGSGWLMPEVNHLSILPCNVWIHIHSMENTFRNKLPISCHLFFNFSPTVELRYLEHWYLK